MSELRPCPFCGCEYVKDDDDFYYMGNHEKWCPLVTKNPKDFGLLIPDIAEAIEAWNTRAELGSGTCRITEYDEAPYPVCSECGAVQPEDFTVYYCWNCGRKVAGDGDD